MNLEIFVALQEVAERFKAIINALSPEEAAAIADYAGRLGEAEGAEDEVAVIHMIAADIIAQQFVKISAEVAAQFNEEMAGA